MLRPRGGKHSPTKRRSPRTRGQAAGISRRRNAPNHVSASKLANEAQPVTQRHARPGFPPKSRHVDSFTPAQSVSRPSRPPRCFRAARLWLKDESLEDSANLPDPDIIAAEILADLEAALPRGEERGEERGQI